VVTNDFLKFWAEFFRQAAAGQGQVTAMAEWIQAGCPPQGVLADLLRSCYGLPVTQPMGGDLWQKAVTEFLTALNAYAPLWGWVPLERYDRLKRKTQRLERKIAAQERTIQQLDALLNEKGLGHAALMTHFQDLINDQTQAFDQLMQTITDVDGSEAP
jgi:uncharacterized coiled-coil protein SlyX